MAEIRGFGDDNEVGDDPVPDAERGDGLELLLELLLELDPQHIELLEIRIQDTCDYCRIEDESPRRR